MVNLHDSGAGSLRQAITDICSGGTINFDPSLSGQMIILSSSTLPAIDKTLTIDGGNGKSITLNGAGTYRIFEVTSAGNLTLNNLTIHAGNYISPCFPETPTSPPCGGGIYSDGALTITNSTFSQNSADAGGAIFIARGTAVISNSTFIDNREAFQGGAVVNWTGTTTISNSTFSGNFATYGGAIYNDVGSLTLSNNTFSNNSATYGGGLYNAGILKLTNNILANSVAGADCFNEDGAGEVVVDAGNLVEVNAAATNNCGVPAVSGDPSLGPLADNGGFTRTMALLSGSPAIDAGDAASCPATDQRGISRPQGSTCDIGAYEYMAPLPTPSPTSTATITPPPCGGTLTVTSTNDAGPGSLRQVIADVCPGQTINFDLSLSGQRIALASTLPIDKDLNIDATSLPARVNISGSHTTNAFNIVLGATVTISNVLITDGNAGGISNNGTLTLHNSMISDNSSTYGGGIVNAGNLTVLDSTITGNVATNDGGGIYNSNGTVTLVNTTISSNTGSYGAGIYTRQGVITITNGTFSYNRATMVGGGIYNFGTLTISDSTFYRNSAASAGGGIYHSYLGTAKIAGSTFFENSSNDSGGAVYNDASTFEITNSTFAGNTANLGGGIYNSGSIVTGDATLKLVNSTLSGNSAAYYGGGLYNIGAMNYANTIIANSVTGFDCYNNNGYTGKVITNINNLVETNGPVDHTCGSPAVTGDPMLAALADNGGSTQTLALLAGSPAIDAGNAASCPDIDQRGVTRPQGSGCDIGAYEYEGSVAPTPTPTGTPPYSYHPLYISLTDSQTVGGVSAADEDILKFDGTNWSLYFDGSDVGVKTPDLSAFSILDANTILMSFSANVTVNGITATPQDVLRFDATSLGTNTAGTFSLYFDGSDVGLDDASNEKIDSLARLPDGRLLISTNGNPVVPGVSGAKDEDVLAFTPTSLGDVTSGTWSMYFDGSDVGLSDTSGEDVDALDVAGGNIYLSTQGDFSVSNVSGANEDVFVCAATSLGDVTACNYSPDLYFDGSTWGLAANNVDGFNILTSGPAPTVVPTTSVTVAPTGTPTLTNTPTPTATGVPTSTPTATPTATTTPIVSTFTFMPVADAYVNAGSPASNYGSSTTLRADASPDVHSYLRFNVQGLTGNLKSATILVYANSASNVGMNVNGLSDTTWTESTINYNNAPPVGGSLGSSGTFTAPTWIRIDITGYVTGNGMYNFALTTPSSTAISFASRESGANSPRLIIETLP